MSQELTPNLGLDLSDINSYSSAEIYDYLFSLKEYECWVKYIDILHAICQKDLITVEILKLISILIL